MPLFAEVCTAPDVRAGYPMSVIIWPLTFLIGCQCTGDLSSQQREPNIYLIFPTQDLPVGWVF